MESLRRKAKKHHHLSSQALVCTARWPAFPEIGSRMCIQPSTLRRRQGRRSFVTPAAFREHLVANHGSKSEKSPRLGNWGLDSGRHACEDVKFGKKSFQMISFAHDSAAGQWQVSYCKLKSERAAHLWTPPHRVAFAVDPWWHEKHAAEQLLPPCSLAQHAGERQKAGNWEVVMLQAPGSCYGPEGELSATSISRQFHRGCCWVLHRNNCNPEQPRVRTVA